MSWNIGVTRNFFFELRSKVKLYHVVPTTPKASLAKFTLTVVEMHFLPDLEKTDSAEEISFLNGTFFNGARKENFKTDRDKLKNVVLRYRKCLYLKK